MPGFLQTLADLPPWLTYIIIGLGAAIENFIPPVPADTFVLLGAFLAANGRASDWAVFLITWVFNVAAAFAVYRLAHRYGRGFFNRPVGRRLLHPKQLEKIGAFYQRWGTFAIFFSRFLPGFRAAVPVFAGVTHVPARRVFLPLAAASGLWYGLLVYLGRAAGRNWQQIMDFFGRFSTILLLVAVLLIGAFIVWWWRTRRHHE